VTGAVIPGAAIALAYWRARRQDFPGDLITEGADCAMRKVTLEESGRAAQKTDAAAVEEYLAAVPEPARTTLGVVRARIRAAAGAEATEGLSYGMPAFRYKGVLVGYAAFKGHCSFFPMSARVLDEFAEDAREYRTSKGTLQFGLDKPLPAGLIKKLVRARMGENEGKKKD